MAIDTRARVYVAGHRGMVGNALWRELTRQGFRNLIGRTRLELDLLDQVAVRDFYEAQRPEYVFVAAARVGGIQANSRYPADFLFENLQIQNHLLDGAREVGVRKLLFLGSSCIYPRMAPQPLREDCLMTGALESTNQWYAVAKIAGVKLCQAYRRQHGCDFICAMPTNLYGPDDNYDLETAHVLPALIRRFHEARWQGAASVTLWGSGMPFREFLYVDDLARACLCLMERYSEEQIINVGSGGEVRIRDLALTVSRVVGYTGGIEWDESKPDGTPRKLLDSSRAFALGWRPAVELESGIRLAYEDFRRRYDAGESSGRAGGGGASDHGR